MNDQTKQCISCQDDFVVESEDFEYYKKMEVPAPTWCPTCRAKRRMTFWNQTNLYKKTEKRTGKKIFSTYPEHAKIEILDHDYWWSDKFGGGEYAKEIDWSVPFLEQVKDLVFTVPWPSRSIQSLVNSEYCNQASWLKNCYLCFNGNSSDNCLYCVGYEKLTDTMDSYAVDSVELCYEISQVGDSFQCFFSKEMENCRDVWFSIDCTDCTDCFGCLNLRHKKYNIFNVQYTKEEYEKKMKSMNTGSYNFLLESERKLQELWMKQPHRYYHGLRNNAVVGDYVWNSKNSKYVYEAGGLEDCKYCQNHTGTVKDSYDYTNWGEDSELIYESSSVGRKCHNVKFCFDCWPAMRESEYSMNCHSCANVFGCVGLMKKQYCILNKQYSKKEYFDLLPKIKKHMMDMPYVDKVGREYKYGEFFPPEFSPLAYNETSVITYYPATKEEVIEQGYSWADAEKKSFPITVKSVDLPDDIKDSDETIVKEVLECMECKEAYRIVEREWQFLERFNIALPRLCVNCRYDKRMKSRNPQVWSKRNCQCAGEESDDGIYKNKNGKSVHNPHNVDEHCPNDFETTYPPNSKEIIYCEDCYNGEVV